MAEPTPLALSGANFASIRDRLENGFGLFVDGELTYVVLDAKTHSIDVLRRLGDRNWTDVTERQPGDVRVTVNGQLFGPNNLYSTAALGTVPPEQVVGQGSIREAGRTIPENPKAGESRYYFGRSKDGKRYRCDLGNPPDDIYEGMGGLGALIMTNPVTGAGLPIGTGNRYASNSGNVDKPQSDDDWRDCTQRNSQHFNDLDEDGDEFCAVGHSSTAKLLIFLINDDDAPGQLTVVRDKLLDAGFDCACFTDGSNSSCMTVDNESIVTPHFIKNRLIEFGFKGVKASPPVALRISFDTLEVVDPGLVEGDEGHWHIAAFVNDVEVATWTRAEVFAGKTLELGWQHEFEMSSASDLLLRLQVDNATSETISGVPGHEISDYEEVLQGPNFGEGGWQISNRDGYYHLHLRIEVL